MTRVAWVLVAVLVATACHSIDRGVFAQGPVPLDVLPLREPITYTVGPNAGQVVPAQHGLLASYFSGAAYVQPAYGEVLDHQQIDPNVDFQWDGSDTNPVIPSGGIDHADGHPFRPDHWPIWSVVWEGYLEAPADDDYVLNLHVNNGGWLQMKDAAGTLTTVISCPGGSGFEGDCPASLSLDKGPHYIRISYYNNAPATANAILSWRRPTETDLSVVPTDALWTQAVTTPTNTPPAVSMSCPSTVFIRDGATIAGRLSDPDIEQDWTATFDGFNQAGPAPITLSADRSFSFTVFAPTLSAGTFNVIVTVRDNADGIGAARCTIVAVPKRLMLYVHGTTGTFRQDPLGTSDFPSLFRRLVLKHEFKFYEYYEDAGNKGSGFECLPGKRRAIPPPDPTAGLPFDLTGEAPEPGICDSNDDVERNAIRLDADMRELAGQFDKVTLLSNSGGGRIVRTYLAYANATKSPSLDLVELVVSMQGVQSGTYVAAVAAGLDTAVAADPDLGLVRDAVLDQVKPVIKHDPRRPLFRDVTPRSRNIAYTNVTVPVPDGPHYLNVNGDMHVNVIQSLFLIPIETARYAIGDTVLLPGRDDPRDMPADGGARFLPSVAGRGASSTQWELTRNFNVHIDPTILGQAVLPGEILDLVTAPESHLFLGAKFDQLCVPYRGVRHLDEVVSDQIAALDSGLPPTPGRLGLGGRSAVACP